jgi:class 3 adenylate cyclase/CHASE2 domain-containing sensor protein
LFCSAAVKPKLVQRSPLLIAVAVIVLACLARAWHLGEALEAHTYDWRVRLAARFPSPCATNLGFVCISDDSITRLKDGSLGFHYGLYWPRHIYGRLVRELAAQGATAAGFDILFADRRPDHAPILVRTNTDPGLLAFTAGLNPGQPPVLVDDQLNVESDDFFAWELRRAGNVVLAADKGVLPHPRFRAQAASLGDISAVHDPDGIIRRARAFTAYREWHPLFEQAAAEYGVDLDRAKVEPGLVTLLTPDRQEIKVPLAADGTFDPVDFGGAAAAKLPRARPFTDRRVWHMGIVLAARELGLDLDRAGVDLPGGKITLRGASGVERVLPVDATGSFTIDWQLPPQDARLTGESVEQLLAQDLARAQGQTNGLENAWRGKLVIIGSTATGNDLTDLGATPLAKETYLMSEHWNIANSVLTGRFVRRSSLAEDCLILALLGALAAGLTLRLRVVVGLGSVLLLAAGYVGLAAFAYVQHRVWLPVFLPVTMALALQYVGLVTWRLTFEQADKRRIRSVFARIVAPEVVQELLASEQISLVGARREVTVLFADVRGFTAFTDASREAVAEFVKQSGLSGAEAEAQFEREARATLNTVNTYLALVADQVKRHGGTLDKYIGDCVMAFWNAPTPAPGHAAACVRAAIDTQRAIADLNRQRADENTRLELENLQRLAAGQPPLPRLPILSLGTGINTGQAVVGLMGSEAHILNYTVFGREVNLASRLEALSGSGRILIGAATQAALLREDAALAAECSALPPVKVKGFREAVTVYEVSWRRPGETAPVGDDSSAAGGSPDTAATGFMRLGE